MEPLHYLLVILCVVFTATIAVMGYFFRLMHKESINAMHEANRLLLAKSLHETEKEESQTIVLNGEDTEYHELMARFEPTYQE